MPSRRVTFVGQAPRSSSARGNEAETQEGREGDKLTTYTPGPWKIHSHGNTRSDDTKKLPWFVVPESHAERVLGGAEDATYDREHYAQEICSFSGSYRHKSDEEIWANAQLIAASPELYDELFRALAVIRNPQAFETEQVATDIERVLAKVAK